MFRRNYYSREFFAHLEDISLASARAVVPEVLRIFPATSVVDVGCGIGTWSSVLAELGVGRVLGIDGAYVEMDQLKIEPSRFVSSDLNQPIAPRLRDRIAKEGRFDLAISLEVAEHLEVGRAEGLVDDLCALADVVLFGAAVPFQGGAGHVNEQWQSYWVAKFADKGYQVYDVLRPVIWSAADVAFWYKQNSMFYVKRGAAAHDDFALRFSNPPAAMLDIVHPELFRGKVWRLKNGHPVQKLLNLMRSSGGLNRAAVLSTPLRGDDHMLGARRGQS